MLRWIDKLTGFFSRAAEPEPEPATVLVPFSTLQKIVSLIPDTGRMEPFDCAGRWRNVAEIFSGAHWTPDDIGAKSTVAQSLYETSRAILRHEHGDMVELSRRSLCDILNGKELFLQANRNFRDAQNQLDLSNVFDLGQRLAFQERDDLSEPCGKILDFKPKKESILPQRKLFLHQNDNNSIYMLVFSTQFEIAFGGLTASPKSPEKKRAHKTGMPGSARRAQP